MNLTDLATRLFDGEPLRGVDPYLSRAKKIERIKDWLQFESSDLMNYEWKVLPAYIGVPQPAYVPPQLEQVLNTLEPVDPPWEVFTILPAGHDQVKVVIRRAL